MKITSIVFILSTIILAGNSLSMHKAPAHTMESLKVNNQIVNSFVQNTFSPSSIPFLGDNCHFQTIVGSEAIRTKLFGSYPRSFTTRGKERVLTPDEDFFDIEFTSNVVDDQCDNIVVILHGLESNTEGALVTKMASAFLSITNTACCLVSFRGCSGEDNLTVGAYHLGFTDDLNQVVDEINLRFPKKKILLTGFSLGGNVCLKFLGEIGEEASRRNIIGGCTVCVPFDPVQSQNKLDQGFNKNIYSSNFLSTLKVKAERKLIQFSGRVPFNIETIRSCTTIGEFDEAFIAPIYGFKDKVEYYRKTGSKWFLKDIRVPTIAINARDDPFIEESSLPTLEDIAIEEKGGGEGSSYKYAPVRLIYYNRGGHCGFIARSSGDKDIEKWGWLANEMKCAINHIIINTTRE